MKIDRLAAIITIFIFITGVASIPHFIALYKDSTSVLSFRTSSGSLNKVDPATAQFFNPATGKPQVWYYKYPEGHFEFYDKPGYHLVTGDPLKPVTKNIYFEWQKIEKAKIDNSQVKTDADPIQNPANLQRKETSIEEGEHRDASDISVLPDWLNKLRIGSVMPGFAVAGVRLNDDERTVIDILGQPTSLHPIEVKNRNDSGTHIHSYALQYRYEGVFLGIYTSPDTHKVYSIRLFDEDFNRRGLIPKLWQGITIGSSVEDLLRAYGNPQKMDRHFTCPATLGKRDAESFYYSGIAFCVCNANNLIYWIDIP